MCAHDAADHLVIDCWLLASLHATTWSVEIVCWNRVLYRLATFFPANVTWCYRWQSDDINVTDVRRIFLSTSLHNVCRYNSTNASDTDYYTLKVIHAAHCSWQYDSNFICQNSINVAASRDWTKSVELNSRLMPATFCKPIIRTDWSIHVKVTLQT